MRQLSFALSLQGVSPKTGETGESSEAGACSGSVDDDTALLQSAFSRMLQV
jgi:hypothetical protein